MSAMEPNFSIVASKSETLLNELLCRRVAVTFLKFLVLK